MAKGQTGVDEVELKRGAITNYWITRADILERQAVCLFRDAGEARMNAKIILSMPDDAVEQVWAAVMAKNSGGDVKTVVEPEDGTGKVN